MRVFLPTLALLSALSACTSTPPVAWVPVSQKPSPSAASPATTARTITILGAGDVLVHPEVAQQAAKDGTWDKMFAGVRPAIEGADLALCHMETPVAPAKGPFSWFPRFSVPPQVLTGVRHAGFDGCSTASNHSLDQGEAGIARTVKAMDAVGLRHTGTYDKPQNRGVPAFYDVKGVKIAQLSYTFGFNGLKPPEGKDWLANRIDPTTILSAARKAKAAGAQIVVLSLHWGTEYRHDPDANQLKWAGALAGSPDIDLVLGHHAHVVQPIRQIKGTWFVFGMGNELARHAEPLDANREGLMVRATFTETAGKWVVSEIERLPTWVDLTPAIRIVNLTAALAGPGLAAAQRKTYLAAYNRVMKYARA
jgi:poly-gamma-glutamate synthesis protein (capsule biosynthesis protein)